MRSHQLTRATVFGLLAVLVTAWSAAANGGQVRIANYPIGPYEITVFTSPTPLLTGTVDVSVLLQRRDTKVIVDDAQIVLTIEPVSGRPSRQYPVTREQATNKLYYAAKFPVDQPGSYRMRLNVRAPEGAGTVEFDLAVERASSSLWRSWWLWGAIVLLQIPLWWWLFGGRTQVRGQTKTRPTPVTKR